MRSSESSETRINAATLLQRLLRGGVTALLVKAVGAVLALALNVYIARLTSPQIYGVYVFALGWIALAAIGMRFGLDTLLVRLVAQHRHTPGYVGAVCRWAALRFAVQTFVTLVLAGGLLLIVGDILTSAQRAALLVAAPLALIVACNSSVQAVVQGFGDAGAFAPEQVLRPALFMILLAFFAGTAGVELSGATLVLLNSGAAVAALLVALLWARALARRTAIVEDESHSVPAPDAWART